MRDEVKRERGGEQQRRASAPASQPEREGVLRDLLRRLVGVRGPEVYVMEPDGQLHRARE